MKKIFCIMLSVILLFSLFATTVFAVNTGEAKTISAITLRAGGGGGSGGGGGGGGSGGGSHHSGSGRPATLLETILHYIMMPFVLFSSTIVFYVKLTKRSRKAKKLMKQMMQSDSAWKYKDISATVNDSFIAIQTAWSNMDMTPAASYMSDDLLESFQMKLNWMAYRKEKNVLENIQLINALPVAVHDDSDNSRDFVWFYIKGKMVDYTIDTDTQLKIDGNTSASSFVEYWKYVRKEDRWVLDEILQKDESEQIPFNE